MAYPPIVRIGILGSGLMGGKLGTLLARAGHDVVLSYSRSERKLKRLARQASASYGSPRDAAQDADAVVLAVHWLRFDDVLAQAGELAGAHDLCRGRAGEEGAEGARGGCVQHHSERSAARRLCRAP